MIDKSSAVKTMLERVAGLPVGHGLELRSYKRDRAILIVRQAEDRLMIRENGFAQETFLLSLAELRPLLKSLLRREFPRSNKLRLYNLGACDSGKEPVGRKKI